MPTQTLSIRCFSLGVPCDLCGQVFHVVRAIRSERTADAGHVVRSAIVIDHFARSQELEDVLLEALFGRAPDEGIRVRLAPIRALTRLYYAGVMLSGSAAASWVKDDTDLSAPTPKQFRLAIDEGRLKRGAPETMHILGKMFLTSFLTGVAPPEIVHPD